MASWRRRSRWGTHVGGSRDGGPDGSGGCDAGPDVGGGSSDVGPAADEGRSCRDGKKKMPVGEGPSTGAKKKMAVGEGPSTGVAETSLRGGQEEEHHRGLELVVFRPEVIDIDSDSDSDSDPISGADDVSLITFFFNLLGFSL